jgi:hypothetical protein
VTPQNAKRAVARTLKAFGVIATLRARRADWLSSDPRPLVFVRVPVPPAVEAAVRLALAEVHVVFAHAEQREEAA